MSLRDELRNIPVLEEGHPALDAAKRWLLNPDPEKIEQTKIFREQYPGLLEITRLVEATMSQSERMTEDPLGPRFGEIGATVAFLCLKEIAEQELIDPSADPST